MPAQQADKEALEKLNHRLMVIRDRVRGVALGHHTGFYLFGRPGTSKTFTVKKTLDAENIAYCYHDGHLTPMGLFDLLAKEHDRVIVLDDVSAIFAQPVALQLLLAALGRQPDHSGERIVKYRRQGREEVVYFSGGIICISNLELHSAPLLEALKSRVHYIGFDPSDEQMAALMRLTAERGWLEGGAVISPAECGEVTEFLIAESHRLDVRLDMRLLVDKAFPDFLQWRSGDTETHWKDLVLTTLQERLLELQHTPTPRYSREQQVASDRQIVVEIVSEYSEPGERVRVWTERTGKSRRAFYRRLAETKRDGVTLSVSGTPSHLPQESGVEP